MDYEKLAQLLFPNITKTPEDLEAQYPPRNLPEGARVTRFAPSPTGYLHIGGLFGALTDVLTAKASGGVSYLRIEDTDKKREIDDGVSAIINGFADFGVRFDEGVTGFGTESGAYGAGAKGAGLPLLLHCRRTHGTAGTAGGRRRPHPGLFRQICQVPRPDTGADRGKPAGGKALCASLPLQRQ